jgi:NTP pyrophosphatase (non-canonical NTP hydrolase)
MEHFQWKNADEMMAHVAENKEDVADEIADVLYWVLLLSNKLDINLVSSLNKKMAKNEAKYPVHKAKGTHKKYTELAI